jgi:hypothetical protein
MEVIILDSISLLGFYWLSCFTGNSFTNWNKITQDKKHLLKVNSDVHNICTMRVKQDYVLSERNGKMVPEKSRD